MGKIGGAVQLLHSFSSFVSSHAQQAGSRAPSVTDPEKVSGMVQELQQEWQRTAAVVLQPYLRKDAAAETWPDSPQLGKRSAAAPASSWPFSGEVSSMPAPEACNMPSMLLQAAKHQLALACQCLAFLSSSLHSLKQALRAQQLQQVRFSVRPSMSGAYMAGSAPRSPYHSAGRPTPLTAQHRDSWRNG